MNKQWTIGIMAAVGLILGKMLWPMLGEYIEKHSINQVTPAQVQQYIFDSKLIKFNSSDYQYSESHHKGNLFYGGALLAEYKTRSNYTFYDPVYKKYFSIQMFDYPDVSSYDDLLKIAKNVPIECVVNINELANPIYGSANNPVPSFKCIIPADTSWKESYKARAKIVERNNAHYETSVGYYLTYFMSKADYEKMFPNHKYINK